MEEKAGAQISRKAFIQSFLILLALMLAAGLLTRLVPAGKYTRVMSGGREVLDPQSFQYATRPDYPIWRWLTAPLEVLAGPDNVTIIIIILFILLVGASFALLDKSGIMKAAVGRIVRRFEGRKYLLLLMFSFFFMFLGAFFGIFEEVVPLIPVMITLSFLLGWDTLTGLGMSILATNMGFSAAITNPFTIGLAQGLGKLPLFSGTWLRIPVFLIIYTLFAIFLVGYAKRVERVPESSPVFAEDQSARKRYDREAILALETSDPRMGRAMTWFAVSLVLIISVFIAAPFVPAVSSLSLPLVGLLFFVAGLGASLLSGASAKTMLRGAAEGIGGIAPGIPLILMAASVKYIVAQGGIMDTILHSAAGIFSGEGTFLAALMVLVIALVLEVFVSSASAKVFLMLPILFPLGDLVGLTRQTIVLAYCFGDGFTNMIYPTNAVLLISLGLASVSYNKWLKWSLKLWAWVLPVVLVFLAIAVVVHYGPF